MKNKKAAIELSANFLITMILAVAMFGVGLKIVFDIVNQGNKTGDVLSQQMTDSLEKEFDDPTLQVAVYEPIRTMKRGDKTSIPFAVANIVGDSSNFTATISCNSAFGTDKQSICTGKTDCNTKFGKWFFSQTIPLGVIEKNARKYNSFNLKVPTKETPSGTYLFDLVISTDTNTLPKQQIQITVP